MPEQNFIKDPRILVWLGLAFPAIYIFFDLAENGWSQFIAYGAAAVGIWFFQDNFIPKSEVRIVKEPQLGPQETFIPPGAERWEFEINPQTGEPVPTRKFHPPMQQQRAPPQYQPYQPRR